MLANEAFNLARAGVDRAVYDLRKDFIALCVPVSFYGIQRR